MASILYSHAAFTDARSDRLDLGVSVMGTDGTITWIGPSDDEPDSGDARVIDAGGTTIVPGMVDAHSHLTMPGGSLLMAGRCGVGRRTAVSVVSHMHMMTLFTPKVSRNYGVKQFKTDLKTVRG